MKQGIVKECARAFGIPAEVIVGRSQCRHVIPARFALYKALRLRGWSYLAIGKFLGRNHATVMYGARRAELLAERDEKYAEKVQQIADWKPAVLEAPREAA